MRPINRKAIATAIILIAFMGTFLLVAQRRGERWGNLGNQPLPRNDAEKLILEVSTEVPRRMNVPMEDGRVIRMLTEAIGAKHAVEIGTSTGYSGLWFALGLRATGGKLTTFEIDPDVANTAREIFKKAGVSDLITVVVGDAHEKVSQLKGPIDIVFIDAEKPGYRDYFDKLLPLPGRADPGAQHSHRFRQSPIRRSGNHRPESGDDHLSRRKRPHDHLEEALSFRIVRLHDLEQPVAFRPADSYLQPQGRLSPNNK